MNKKGEEGAKGLSTMVEIILWILGFVLVLGVVMIIITRGSDATEESICRDSVVIRGKANVEVGYLAVADKITPLLCSPIDKGKIDGSREDVKGQIAELAAKCWWMYAQGKINDLFKVDKGEQGCNICYIFSIPDTMDEGESSANNFFLDKVEDRQKDNIGPPEMYNYLIDHNYNAKLLYGGGTSNYAGDMVDFDVKGLPDPTELRLSDIKFSSKEYLLDFADAVTPDSGKEIVKLGDNLKNENGVNLLVVVAEKLSRNEKKDARRLIEAVGLNSDDDIYDSMLVIVDIDKGQVRLQLGSKPAEFIGEPEIKEIIKSHFSKESFGDNASEKFNKALLGLLNELNNKLHVENDKRLKELSIGKQSYYAYISNKLSMYPTINNISAERTYAVAFMSPTSYTSWIEGVLGEFVNVGKDLGPLGAVSTVVLLTAAMGAGPAVLIPMITTGAVIGVGGAIGGSFVNQDMASGFTALIGNVESQNPNHLIIDSVNHLSRYCNG